MVKTIVERYGLPQENPTVIFEDNQSCIKFIENEKMSARIKHLDIRKHYVREMINKNEVFLEYCPSENNQADLLTKPLLGQVFKRSLFYLGLY